MADRIRPKRAGLGLLLMGLLAGSTIPAAAQDIAFRGWGLRAGVADDPDQGVVGAQFNFGEFIPNLRFQPHIDLGFGDDTTIVSVTAPVHYRLPLEGKLTLYGGAGVTAGFIDRDEDRGRGNEDDGSDFDISPMLAGGIEWPVGNNELAVEVNVTGGDFSTVKLVVGWMF